MQILRNPADLRAVAVVGSAVALVALQYALPQTVPYVLPFSCYLAVACGVIAHNHNHRHTFVGRLANQAFGNVLTLFYGYPTLMWLPTHNLNHHRFVNRPGDATITWRYTNRHNMFVAFTYFFVSSYFQSEPIQRYIRRARQQNRNLYAQIIFQYVFFVSTIVLMLGLALLLHNDRWLGLFVWFFAIVVPALCSIFAIMFFNYAQHVHADSTSEYNHSRNFTGRWLNFFLFNNGYHTAHHEHPGLHWSDLPEAHARLAPNIDSRLIEPNVAWYLTRQYLLAPLFPRLGSRQLGPEPGQSTPHGLPNEQRVELTAERVDRQRANQRATAESAAS